MAETIPTARLEEIRDGCEGVTPGPWRTLAVEFVYSLDQGGANVCACGEPRGSKIIGYTNAPLGCDESAHNAIHIARLDPQTIRAIVSELIERRNKDKANG